jgi:hypothetical protein
MERPTVKINSGPAITDEKKCEVYILYKTACENARWIKMAQTRVTAVSLCDLLASIKADNALTCRQTNSYPRKTLNMKLVLAKIFMLQEASK